MTVTEIYAELTRVFRQVLGREDIVLTPELTAADVPAWNSFKQIEILLEVEARFAVTLTSREVDRLENVGDLVRMIVAQQSRGS